MMAQRYETIGLLILVALALVPPGLTLLAFMDWLKSRLTGSRRRKWLWKTALAADVLLALCLLDGWLVEPHRLTVTRIADTSPKIARTTGDLTIVHISDIHFEQDNPFVRKVLSTIAEEKPDFIVLTGDIPQLGPFDKEQLKQWLGKLRQIAPVYAVPGYYEDDAVLAGSRISDGVLLASQFKEKEVRGTKIVVQGFGPNSRISPADRPDTDDALYLVLDHAPDSIPYAARLAPDWFFCGHTHGGQVRLPFWGAIVTASFTGKRYEYGRYHLGTMQAFVTRGIGLEPRPAPQVRFLCPPEVVVLKISRSVGQ